MTSIKSMEERKMINTLGRTRYIPAGFRAIEHPLGAHLGVAYMGSFGDKFGVIAYRGKASKSSFYYTYRDEIAARKKVDEFFDGLAKWEDMKTARRSERSAPHTLKIGDILHYSWGYDQTNCEFYQIIATTAHTVTIREIAQESVGNPGGSSMSDRMLAIKDSFLDKPAEKHHADGHNYVPMKFGACSLWDGRPCYSSWYA